MKSKILTIILLASVLFSCEDDPKPTDPIYEFVAFKGSAIVNVNELANSENAWPLVLELRAFAPYEDAITVTFEVTGNNATEGIDFTVTPAESITIPAGSFLSDTIFIKTIDNQTGSAEPRSFDIGIASVSKNDIKIGLGIMEPRNAAVKVNILDDECSETTDVFDSPLANNITYSGGGAEKPASGTLAGNTIKVTGDLIDYGSFPNAALTITLTPDGEGATKGDATFGEQEVGTDNDGYDYKFVQVGEGRYDVCSGTISVEYDIYYMDGDWVYWYSVTNTFAIE